MPASLARWAPREPRAATPHTLLLSCIALSVAGVPPSRSRQALVNALPPAPLLQPGLLTSQVSPTSLPLETSHEPVLETAQCASP